MKFKVNPEYASLNPPLSTEEYEDLKESIKHDGIRTDLHVLPDGTILCGHNRYKIAKEVGIPDEIDRKIYVIADNLYRRQLTTPWRIELTSILDTFEREKAEQRRKSTLKKGNEALDVENFPPRDEQGRSRDKLGEKAGVSGKTYEKAMKIKEKKPDLWKEEVLDGKKSIDKAYREIKQQEMEQGQRPLPEGDYKDFGSLSNPNEFLTPVKKEIKQTVPVSTSRCWMFVKINEDENKQKTTSLLKLEFRSDNGYFVYKSEDLVQIKDAVRKSSEILKINKHPGSKEKQTIRIVLFILPRCLKCDFLGNYYDFHCSQCSTKLMADDLSSNGLETGINELVVNKIHNMNCIEGMKKLDDNSINCIITSPPYNIKKDYGAYSDDLSPAEYEVFSVKALLECYRILKPQGICVVVVGEHKRHLLLTKTRNWLLSIGFSYIKKVDWYKSDYLGFSVTDYIVVCCKGDTYLSYYSEGDKFYGGKNQFADTWFIPYETKFKENEHPATFPVAIPQKLIEINTKKGDIVFDPFMGSGSTAVAAKLMNRKFIGFELSKRYCELAEKRLSDIHPIKSVGKREPKIVKVQPIEEKSMLNSALRAYIAMYHLESEKHNAKERQRNSPEPLPLGTERGRAIDVTAKKFGLSDRTFRRVLKIQNYIKKNSDDEYLIEMWNEALRNETPISAVLEDVNLVLEANSL